MRMDVSFFIFLQGLFLIYFHAASRGGGLKRKKLTLGIDDRLYNTLQHGCSKILGSTYSYGIPGVDHCAAPR
jgi:hypothetical protein